MRIFSDFRLFERRPKIGTALFRWIAWRWLLVGSLVVCFAGLVAAMHFLGGEPVYFKNENRNLTDREVWEFLSILLFGGGLFLILGWLGVLFIPKD